METMNEVMTQTDAAMEVKADQTQYSDLPALIPNQGSAALSRRATIEETRISIAELHNFVEENFQEGVDYGPPFPGSDKKSLLLPGAEKFNLLFRTRPRVIIKDAVRDFATGHCFYHIGVELVHIDSGVVIGYGEGSCTNLESKYRYRNGERVCPECGKATIKRSKFPPRGMPDAEPGWYCFEKIGGCGAQYGAKDSAIVGQTVGLIENEHLHDLWNTMLKMAIKRAIVGAVCLTGGVSELFTQDADETPEGESGYGVEPPKTPIAEPQEIPETDWTKLAAAKMNKIAKLTTNSDAIDFLGNLGFEKLDQVPKNDRHKVMVAIDAHLKTLEPKK
jgi:hypothetical protein